MSDTDEQKVCQSCADFEPQTWRKSLCKNCFHTLEEHSAEILANEAELVAKEKSSAKPSEKATDSSTEKIERKLEVTKVKDTPVSTTTDVKSKDDVKGTVTDKDTSSKNVNKKYSSDKGSGKNEGSWSWAIDLGRGYGKPAKPAPQDTTSSTKVPSPASSTSSTVSSTKTSPQTSAKPSLKPTGVLSLETSSSSSTTTATTATPTETASTSKAKNFASKFESKASALSKAKPPSTPRDIRPGATSVSALTSKLTDTTVDSKIQSKPLPEKLTEPHKPDSKSLLKTTNDTKVTETTSKIVKTSMKAKDDIKTGVNRDCKVITEESKDKKPISPASKFEDKGSKTSVSSPSKSLPFGKDLLRSTKDSIKKESSSADSTEDKTVASQAKKEEASKTKTLLTNKSSLADSSIKLSKDKSSFGSKIVSETDRDERGKKSGDVSATLDSNRMKISDVGQSIPTRENSQTVSDLCTSGDSEHEETGNTNRAGHVAKSTGRMPDGKSAESSESKERIGPTKHSDEVLTKCQNNEGEKGSSSASAVTDAGRSSVNLEQNGELVEGEVKYDTVTSSSSYLVNTGETSLSFTSTASKLTTPTATSADSKSSPFVSSSEATSDRKQKDALDENARDNKSTHNALDTSKDREKVNHQIEETSASSIAFTSSLSSLSPVNNDEAADSASKNAKEKTQIDVKDSVENLHDELKVKEEQLTVLTKQLSKMEEQVRVLEEDRERVKRASLQTQKEDLEKLLNELRAQLSKMEEQCSRLEKDNQLLIDKLHVQEASVKRDQECRGKNSDNVDLEEDLEEAEKELEDVQEENKELQRHIMEMKNEMEEMYDHFRENEHDEFRELQKELDITAKNCRILQFKLRKAERRNEQIEQDRVQYEEKLRMLQDQFDSQDAKNHIRVLEDELRMAKEVSVRLHDELDVLEDKRNKALEENRHLTELLEHTDKRQFRLEMEIDKLRDIVADMKQQLKEAKSGSNNNNKESTPDRKVLSSIYTRSID